MDPLAKEIGAVNVVVSDDGVLTGYNTDAEAFLHVLLEQGVEPEGKTVVRPAPVRRPVNSIYTGGQRGQPNNA